MEVTTQLKASNTKCVTVNRKLLKTLAVAQLGLAALLTLFSTVIDPPSLVNILIAASVAITEGSSIGVVWHYLRNGCFT